MIGDTVGLVHDALARGERILLEGAQATFLDLDHGTYPFVTSSNPVAGGACVGSGLGPRDITVHRRYRQGLRDASGRRTLPHRTDGETEEYLVTRGHEFGTNTGRRRRVGWFDVVMARQAVRLNSLSEIALTKLDVLDKFDEIKVCVAYDHEGVRYEHMPFHQSVLHDVTPIYETIPGWQSELTSVSHIDQMPDRRSRLRAIPRSEDRRSHRGRGGGTRARAVCADRMTRCVVVGSGCARARVGLGASQERRVVVTPGNAGIAAHGLTCVATPAIDLEADLFVIGPEQPLVDGLADQLAHSGKDRSSVRAQRAHNSRAPRRS